MAQSDSYLWSDLEGWPMSMINGIHKYVVLSSLVQAVIHDMKLGCVK